MAGASAFAAPTDPNDISEAEQWFRSRTPVSNEEWESLSEGERVRAFRVAGVAQLDLVQDVFSSLADAIREGTSFDDWRKLIGQHIEDAWAGSVENPAWRLEVIFRTNIQSAYSAGRYAQATDPDVIRVRPYWRFDTIADSRRSPICTACANTTLPADDPWWNAHIPPLHHCCRSTIITLTARQAERFGLTEKPTRHEADEGFGSPPAPDSFEPSKSDYSPQLWQIFKNKHSAEND